MSSNADFVSAQRRLLNLYENGHNMNYIQMTRALDGLLGVTQQMVRNRREEIRNQVTHIPITTPGSPPRRRPATPPGSPPGSPPRHRPATPPGSPPRRRALTPPPQEQAQAPPPVRRNWPNLAAASAADYLRAGDYEQAREAIGRAERADVARYTGPVRPSALLREINEITGVTFAAARAPLGQRRDWMSWQFYAPVYIKKRAIGQARFEANCTEACAICLDTHTNGESVVTEECKHCFGKECWKTWMCNPTGNQTCPSCRTDRPKVIAYTMRRPRANAMVEDDAISEITQEN